MTEYDYLDTQDATNNPDKNTLIATTTINNVENITDDNGDIITNANITNTDTYDLLGNIVTSIDGKNNITNYEYDELNRITKQTNPDLTHKDTNYNTQSQEIIVTDEKQNKQKYIFDGIGRYTGAFAYKPETGSWISAENITYDNASRINTKTINIKEDGSEKAIILYDYYPNGRLWKETVRENNENGKILNKKEYTYTEYINDPIYGVCSKVKTAVHRDGSNITNIYQYYNNWGHLVKEQVDVKQKNGATKTLTQTYTHDYIGNKLTVKDFRAHDENWSEEFTEKYDYDYAGRILKAYNTNNKYIETEYDRLGRTITEYDYKGYPTNYKYNAINQLTETISPFEYTGRKPHSGRAAILRYNQYGVDVHDIYLNFRWQ